MYFMYARMDLALYNEVNMHALNGCEISAGGVYQEQGRCAARIL